jgi:hypothetical protein
VEIVKLVVGGGPVDAEAALAVFEKSLRQARKDGFEDAILDGRDAAPV